MSTTNPASGDSTTIITGGTHVQAKQYQVVNYHHVSEGEDRDVDKLLDNVAPTALYNTAEIEDPAKCHPGTREAILRRLFAALDRPSADPNKPFIWLHGAAGAGKSAIARTLCEQLHAENQLLASFFFFRASPERNTAARLISTLTYQFRTTIPQLRPHIKQYIRANPLIFRQSLDAQARHLLIDPIRRLHDEGKLSKVSPTAIVIDGLDECEGTENRRNVLHILHTLQSELPFPITILVASRPNREIEVVFKDSPFEGHTIEEPLNNERDVDADILKFYTASFARIEKFHLRSPYFIRVDGTWPGPAIIQLLIEKTSGQFIFAKTVIRFVEPDTSDPDDRLQMILGALPSLHFRPFQQLDAVYKIILSSIEPERISIVLTIIRLFLCDLCESPYDLPVFAGCRKSSEIDTPDCSAQLVEWMLDFKPGQCRQFLGGLEALLTLSPDGKMEIFHKSFSDFLFDSSRSSQFYVAQDLLYERILCSFIRHHFYHPSAEPRCLMLTNMAFLFSNTRVTPELLSEIKSVDLFEADAVVRRSQPPSEWGEDNWLRISDLFVRSLLNSDIVDKELLAEPLLASLRVIATNRLAPYLTHPTLWPLLYAATRDDPPPGLNNAVRKLVPHIPPDLLQLEQTNGHHFTTAGPEIRDEIFYVLYRAEGPMIEAARAAFPQHQLSDDYMVTLLLQLVDQCIKGTIEPSFLVSSKFIRNTLSFTPTHDVLGSKLSVFCSLFKEQLDADTMFAIRQYEKKIQRVQKRLEGEQVQRALWDPEDPKPILHHLTDDWDHLADIIEAEQASSGSSGLGSSVLRQAPWLSPSVLYPIPLVVIAGLILYRRGVFSR